MSGMNCTLVAYGQHGSGKTYSMVGASGAPGMAQCAARDMFEYISQNPDREFLLRVSMCEVRRNAVHDLLKTPALVHHHQHQHQHQPPPLAIRADSLRGTVVDNLSEVIVTSPAQVCQHAHSMHVMHALGFLADACCESFASHHFILACLLSRF